MLRVYSVILLTGIDCDIDFLTLVAYVSFAENRPPCRYRGGRLSRHSRQAGSQVVNAAKEYWIRRGVSECHGNTFEFSKQSSRDRQSLLLKYRVHDIEISVLPPKMKLAFSLVILAIAK